MFFRGRKRDQRNIRLSGGVSLGEHADELDFRAAFVDRIDAAESRVNVRIGGMASASKSR